MKHLLHFLAAIILTFCGKAQNCPQSDWPRNGAGGLFSFSNTYANLVSVSDSGALFNGTFKFATGRPQNSDFRFGIACSRNWNDINVDADNYFIGGTRENTANPFPVPGMNYADTLFTNIIVQSKYFYPNCPKPGGYNFYLKNLLPHTTYYAVPYIVWHNTSGGSPVYYLTLFTPFCFKTTNKNMGQYVPTPSVSVSGTDTNGVNVSATYSVKTPIPDKRSKVYFGLYWGTDTTRMDTLTPLSNKNYVYFSSPGGSNTISGANYSTPVGGLKSQTTYYFKAVTSVLTPDKNGIPHIINLFSPAVKVKTGIINPVTWFNKTFATDSVGGLKVDGPISPDSTKIKTNTQYYLRKSRSNVFPDSSLFQLRVCWSKDSMELINLNPLSFSNQKIINSSANWYGGGATPLYYQATNLKSGTKYYFRTVFSWVSTKKTQGAISVVNKFSAIKTVRTKTPFPPLQNNIMSGNKVICWNNPGSKPPGVTLNANIPSGGFGTKFFSYKWIQSDAKGKIWTSCPNGNSQNYVYTSNICPPNNTLSTFQFKRIVIAVYNPNSQLSMTDTSNAITVTIAGPGYNFKAQPVILPMPQRMGCDTLYLRADLPGALGGYKTKWFFNAEGFKSENFVPDSMNASGALYHINQPNQSVKATMSYGPGCPNFDTPIVGSTNKDASGNVYPFTLIGAQFWMVSNLSTVRYNDGRTIGNIVSQPSMLIKDSANPALYINPANNLITSDGAFYNYPVIKSQDVCPVDWHVATLSDWLSLFSFAGNPDGTYAARYLKTTDWLNGNLATNHYNFNATASGQVVRTAGLIDIGTQGSWWYFDKQGIPGYIFMTQENHNAYIKTATSGSDPEFNSGHSIRCVKNYIPDNN